MSSRRFRHLLVIDGERLVGILSDRDILRGLSATENWRDAQIAEYMTANPITVAADTPLSTVISQILTHRINCLPVVDSKGSLCGLLTSTDLLRSYQAVLAKS
jgi:acetoin utilization protein AcuB